MAETAVKEVRLGTQTVKFPSPELLPLEDCNHLVGNKEALLKELDEKGYVLIRGFLERDDVLEARLAVLKHMKSLKQKILDKRYPWEQGVVAQSCGVGCIPPLQGKNHITHSETVSKILEGPRPFSFFKTLFGEDARTFDYKWLRAVNRQEFTGAHCDSVYMNRGTSNLLTMWTPFGDVNPTIGSLAICEGSNRLPEFARLHETYSEIDVEAVNLNGTGWFTTDPFEITRKFGGQWKTSHFNAGDVLIFTMKTVHMSTANLTDFVRISCDTRWQPASQPADPRYVGDFKMPETFFGLHHNLDKVKPDAVTMEELKAKWGLQ